MGNASGNARLRPGRGRWGPVVGIGVALLGCAAFGLGLYDRLDNFGLDLHFRHSGRIEADPRITLIDINDHALRSVGDWPWPRRRYAQIIDTLSELGAQAIVFDLVLSEPAQPRRPSRGKHYDIDTDLAEIGDRDWAPEVFDDDELQRALASAGNVYLSMFFRLSPPGVNPTAVFDEAMALVRRAPAIGEAEFGQTLRTAHPRVERVFDLDSLLQQTRIATRLEDRFDLEATDLFKLVSGDAAAGLPLVEQHLPAAKQAVALRAARRFLAARPDVSFSDFLATILPSRAEQVDSRDRADLIEAYRKALSIRALAASNAALPEAVAKRAPYGYAITIPVEKFAAAAKGIGFVSFDRDERGGVVRDIPLVAEVGGVMVMQLGVGVALDALGVDRSKARIEGQWLVFGDDSAERRIAVTGDGLTLLNWHVAGSARQWQESFDHLPVSRVLEIPLNEEAMADNRTRLRLAMAELVKLRFAETPAEYSEYVRLINRRLEMLRQPREEQADDLAAGTELDAGIETIESDAMVWLRRVNGLWQSAEPTDDRQQAQRDAVFRLHAMLGDAQLSARIDKTKAKLEARNKALMAELRPRVEGKICLVGYTATGMADLVTSPVYDSMPGVMAHANIINMLLQDRPAARVPVWLNLIFMLLSGIGITLICCVCGPLVSAVSLLLLAIGLLVAGDSIFGIANYHIASLAVAAHLSVTWACMTAYRQFTAERARREFQRALAQYTAPAVAARIAARASVMDMAPQPAEVTCFFSDLQGFTALSERLGAEATRAVLNPYLRAMSAVLVKHGALINKFIGDGIFAFFNAPILPCAKHSAAACGSALACVKALRELNHRSSSTGQTDPLVMRIGLSTGNVFVGDYGSDTKLDYTCIGHTVNLASRLEGANKALGTTILVDAACRQAAGTEFTFRSPGGIDIPGISRAVEVYELIDVA